MPALTLTVGRKRDLAERTPQVAATSRARNALSDGFSSWASARSCCWSNWGSVTGNESASAMVSGTPGSDTPIRRNSSSLASFSVC